MNRADIQAAACGSMYVFFDDRPALATHMTMIISLLVPIVRTFFCLLKHRMLMTTEEVRSRAQCYCVLDNPVESSISSLEAPASQPEGQPGCGWGA